MIYVSETGSPLYTAAWGSNFGPKRDMKPIEKEMDDLKTL